MWYPDIKIGNWIKKYPDLKEEVPNICTCGEVRKAIPFVSENWVGLKFLSCKCGKLSSRVSIPRSEKLKKELVGMLSKI